MKLLYKILSLLLTGFILIGITGCGNDQNGSPDSSSGNGEQIIENGSTVLESLPLPLTDDPNAELTVWIGFFDTSISDLNQCENIQYLQEVTGVHINWITVSDTEYAQRFQLLPVSNNLPDIIYPQGTMHDVDKAISDGWLMDMSGLIERYMPNYRRFLTEHPVVRDYVSSMDGTVRMSINFFGDDAGPRLEWNTLGLSIRQDLIESAGYTGRLETVDDYYAMLTQVKSFYPDMTSPLYTNFNWTWNSSFRQPFDAYPALFVNDGVVKYGPAEPGYGAWLAEMRKWFSEGLIEPNFDSVGVLEGLQAPAHIVNNNMSVLFSSAYSRTGTVMPIAYGLTSDPSVRINAVPSPVLNLGDRPVYFHGNDPENMTLGSVHISVDSKNPELAAMWLDFMFTEQAMRILYYGREGVHYTVNDSPDAPFRFVFTEAYDTADKRRGIIGSPSVGWYNWASGYQLIKRDIDDTIERLGIVSDDNFDSIMGAIRVWDDQDLGKMFTDARLTNEEERQIATIYTDIGTYVSEYESRFIRGITDQSFDNFVSTLYNSLQLGRLLEIYQQAYDRMQ